MTDLTVAVAPTPAVPQATNQNQTEYPIVGVAAVMLGAVISTLNSRITSSGLSDVSGALGLGLDQGSWINTVFSAGQMVVAPAAAWMSTVLGTRRVLLATGAVFAFASILPPLTHDYGTLLVLQLIRGLAVGAFIPAALGFVLRSLAPRWWIWGIAAYAFRFVFSQNIGAAIEGWYSETGRWEWIFWQNAALTPVMMGLVALAMPHRPVDRDLLDRTDWDGIILAGVGFGLIYAGLDQGNRLDWFNSGIVSGMLAGGGVLVLGFLVREGFAAYPLIHLPVLMRRNIALPAFLLTVFGFGVAGTSFVLPDYLTRVQGLRALQIGDALNWIALPQFVLVPCVALLLQRVDARLLLGIGFATIALGLWLDTGLTHDWVSADFLPGQVTEAIGLAFAITALITYTVANITPPQAAAIAATLQISRLLGNELGSAVLQTFVRVREQLHSNLLGLHIAGGAVGVEERMTQLSQAFADRPTGLGDATAQGTVTLAGLVRREAYVLAYIDTFWLIAAVALAGTLLVLLLPRAPVNPLTPPRRVR
ncbi:MAG: MFS transporter [Alphaproteobacteria bacterium]|nr:MFS transporter [Alphaproteobacteria bacterium]